MKRYLKQNTSLTILILSFCTGHLAAQGPATSWAKTFGGSQSEYGYGITLDNQGNIYAVGSFNQTVDFNPGAGTFNLTSVGDQDAYLLKLSPTGGFLWACQFGSPFEDIAYAVTVDNQNNVIVTGSFSGDTDFDPGNGVFTLSSQGNRDVFIVKLSSQGNFIWAKSFGYVSSDKGLAVVTDNQNNIYTTGYYSYQIDMNPSAVQDCTLIGVTGFFDVFVSKLDPNGNFIAACTFGGSLDDFGNAIDVDPSGNVILTGSYQNTVDLNPATGGTQNVTAVGDRDVFVMKLNSSLGFIWGASAGGIFQDNGCGIKSDAQGNIYVTGDFRNTVDFDPGNGVNNISSFGNSDVFVLKLSTTGSFIWAGQAGGANSDDRGYDLDLDATGNVYVTGNFTNVGDFDPGPGTFNLNNPAGNTVFAFKWTSGGNFVWARAAIYVSNLTDNYGRGIVVNSGNNAIVTGEFLSDIDFNGGTGTPLTINSNGSWDSFVWMLDPSGVGFPDEALDAAVVVYPNPFSGEFSISLPENYRDYTVEIFNPKGQLVYSIGHPENNILHLSVNLSKGLYLIKVASENGSFTTRKLVVE